jgi:DUF4097 and DUF4098 domain-containing protein YvlB
VIFLLLAALAAARPAAAETTRDFDQRLGMSRGDRVRVNDVNGDIVATRSASNQVRVRARISSPNDDLAGVSIKVSQRGSTVYVCPVFSGQTVGDDCRSEGDNNNWRKIRVDFTIEVPAGVNLDADTVNGKIVADVDGNVVAKNVNQSIQITSGGYAQAETVNGTIDATLSNPNWPDTMKFATVNGAISVRVPRSSNFNVKASSLNGAIKVEGFPLAEKTGQWVGHSLEGTVGSGGRTLRLQTVNGTIFLGPR